MIMTNSDSDDFLADPQPRSSKLSKKKKKNKENGLQKAHTSTQNDNPNINTCRHLSCYTSLNFSLKLTKDFTPKK